MLRFLFLSLFLYLINLHSAHADAVCRQLTILKFSNGADYVPGVDVHGKPVAPADLNDSGASIVEAPYNIPIEIDLAERYGLTLPAGAELKPEVAAIQIYKNGRVSFNGVDVTQDVVAYCNGEQGKEADTTQKDSGKTQEPHGQKAPDLVPSNGIIEGQYPEPEN